MKTFLALMLGLLAVPLGAQTTRRIPYIDVYGSDPTGVACTTDGHAEYNGTFYYCNSGAYAPMSGQDDAARAAAAAAQSTANSALTTANAALPKAGGTMTGGLIGTTANFSGGVTASLTGHASLDLPLTGGTLSGALGSNVTNPAAGLSSSSYAMRWGSPIWSGQTPISTSYYHRAYDAASIHWSAWSHNYWNTAHGPAGGVVNALRDWNAVNNTTAQLQDITTLLQANPGDFAHYDYMYTYGSGLNVADEGDYGHIVQLLESPTTFAGTVATITSSTQLAVTPSADSGDQGTQRPFLDLSRVVATGTITAHTASPNGILPESYAVSISTGALPVSTAWGPLTSDCNGSSSTPLEGTQTNTVTCTVTLSSGSFSAGDGVSFGGNYHETAKVISAGTPSGGQQTITVALQYYHQSGSWVMANGCWDCYVVFTPNIGDGLKYPITVLGSTNGTTNMTVVAFVTGSQNGIGSSYTANLFVGTAGHDEFTIYRGAQVVDVQNPSTFAVDGSFILMPNSGAIQVGDSVEESHAAVLHVTGDSVIVANHNPQTWGVGSTVGWQGRYTLVYGAGIASEGTLGFYGDHNGWGGMEILQNLQPRSSYRAFGGYLVPPRGLIVAGLAESGLEMQFAPSDNGGSPAGAVVAAGCPMDSSGNADCTINTYYAVLQLGCAAGLCPLYMNPALNTFASAGGVTWNMSTVAAFQVPTVLTTDNSTKAASTAFVKALAYAPLASPGLTGVPTAPTASLGTNTTQLATTAFVQAAVTPIRAGSWTITNPNVLQAVTFATAMGSTPSSCTVSPSGSTAATGTPYVTNTSTTGFTVHVDTTPTSTLTGTYQCVINNAH